MRPATQVLFLSVFALVVIYLLVLQIQAIWPFTIDDMYITLRYAHQWASHGALVWNVGEVPVEGYSNFTFVWIARFFEFLHVDPVFGLKIIGVASLIALCIGIFLLTKHVVGLKYAAIPVIWLLTYRGEIIWAVSGLETTFYQSTLVFGVYYLLKGLRQRELLIAGCLFALLGVTRPEGGALALCYFFLYAWSTIRQPDLKSRCLCLTGMFSVLYLPYLAWRWSYFGYLWPNSVYCKAVSTQFMGVLDAHYLKLVWPFLCCALPLLSVASCRRVSMYLLMPSVFYLIFCWTSDPIVAFDNRLFLPALALLFVLAVMGLSQVIRQSWLLYLVFVVLLVWAIPRMSLESYRHFTTNPVAGARLRREVSHWLSMHAKPTQHVVLSDSGLIPYMHPELNFIDSYCLNNLAMGHTPAEVRYTHFCDTLLQEHPNYIILTAWIHEGQVEYTPADVCLKTRLSKNKHYQLLNVFRTYSPDHTTYQYELFSLKPDALESLVFMNKQAKRNADTPNAIQE